MVSFKGRVDDMRASRYIATVNLPQSMLDRLAADARVCIEFGPGSTPSALHVDGDTFQLRPTTEELVDCLVEQGGRMLSIGPVHDKIAVVKTSADAARAQAAARAGGHATSAAHLAPDVVVRDESSLRGRGRLAGRQSRGRGRGRQAAPGEAVHVRSTGRALTRAHTRGGRDPRVARARYPRSARTRARALHRPRRYTGRVQFITLSSTQLGAERAT